MRDIDTDWNYENCSEYLDNPDELVNADTKKILDTAIANPEVQIDFLDFLNSLPDNDKVILLQSLGDDYSKDELANMLVPVFLSQSNTEAGKTALEILGNSKSQLAYHALNSALDFVDETLISAVKKNLSILKLSGIREDNSIAFYKEILKDSKPYKFCITYPDGHGNQAVIVSRINKQGKVQFVAIVIDDYKGIRDCFGFNEISKFECNTIIERFYRGQRALDLNPELLKAFLVKAEKLSKHQMPYEYVCWKNLLVDIETENLDKIIDLIKKSAEEANSRTNALRKDRCFKIGELIDSTHIEVQLLSDTEVIPSRAMTALSRSMITLDSANILDDHIYRGCVLKSETIKTSCNINITNISDVQLLTSITERVFGQTNMNNRDKKLSREYTEKIRSIMLEYINQKTLTDNQFKV